MAYPFLSDVVRDLFGINIPLPVPMFGLMVGIAYFVGLKVTKLEAARLIPELPSRFVENVGFIGFVSGLIGARIFHLLEHPREFLEHPFEMLFSRGGFTIFGGLIVGVSAGLVYARMRRAPIPLLLDAVAPALLLGYAIGRIGCQISGDGDWGIAADLAAKPAWLPQWFWAQTYDGNILGQVIPPPGVYPTPLYEVVMGLLTFAVLWALRKHTHRAGWLFCVYLVLAGVERLLIETIRVNTTYDIAGVAITQAQIIAAVCVVAGCAGMWWKKGDRSIFLPKEK